MRDPPERSVDASDANSDVRQAGTAAASSVDERPSDLDSNLDIFDSRVRWIKEVLVLWVVVGIVVAIVAISMGAVETFYFDLGSLFSFILFVLVAFALGAAGKVLRSLAGRRP